MKYRTPRPATRHDPYFEYDHTHPSVIRPVEQEIWAMMRLLGVEHECLGLLRHRLRTRARVWPQAIARQVRCCLAQAEDYFWMAAGASSRTAPVLHYYCMLNLAKALIYLNAPKRLTRAEHFYHGLTDPSRIKRPDTFNFAQETVRVRPGVFTSLFHVLTGDELPDAVEYRVADLLAYCIWIQSEYEDVVEAPPSLVDLLLRVATDAGTKQMWLTADIRRSEVNSRCGTLSNFQTQAPAFFSIFHRVRSEDPDYLLLESEPTTYTTGASRRTALTALRRRLVPLRLFRFLYMPDISYGGYYMVPLDMQSSPPLPEPCVIFAITFYLSSLVRYQPHIFDQMLGGHEAWLLESFIRQCPIAFCHIMLNHFWHEEYVFHRH